MAATIVKSLGTAIRTAGQAIDSMGAAMQGKYAYGETCKAIMPLLEFVTSAADVLYTKVCKHTYNVTRVCFGVQCQSIRHYKLLQTKGLN